MASLADLNVDIKKLGEQLKADLPSYAKPLFIRLVNQLEHTGKSIIYIWEYFCSFFVYFFCFVLGSFKLQKTKLAEEGYNVDKINDKIYYFDARQKNYIVLTNEIHQDILNRNHRF